MPSMHQEIREQHVRDMLAWIEEWQRADGEDRAWWRRQALDAIAEFRTRYRIPERAAYSAALSRNAQRTSHHDQ